MSVYLGSGIINKEQSLEGNGASGFKGALKKILMQPARAISH